MSFHYFVFETVSATTPFFILLNLNVYRDATTSWCSRAFPEPENYFSRGMQSAQKHRNAFLSK